MTAVTAYMGAAVDHLYLTCPAVSRNRHRRALGAGSGPFIGDPCVDRVDPEGTDICGWCARVWRSRMGGWHA